LARVSPRADLVFFLDADDRYAAHRNEVIVNIYLETKFDALAHLYIAAEPLGQAAALLEINETGREFNRKLLIRAKDLRLWTARGKLRDRQREVLGLESATLRIDRQPDEPLIQHAHLIVSKHAFSDVVFHERYVPRNEDSLMLKDLLFSGKNVVVLCKSLSVWVKGTSSYSLQYKLRHLALRIRQVFFMMGSRSGIK
jgi:hypothetical protein